MSSLILKLIAMVSMLVDHTACALKVSGMLPYGGLYQALRYIGRLAFPIYGFLLVQGAIHTKSKWKYLLRLAILAVLSEVPFDLTIFGTWYTPLHQNVFLTLFLGLLSVYAIQYGSRMENRIAGWGLAGLIAILCAVTAEFLHTDYAAGGVFMIAAMGLEAAELPRLRKRVTAKQIQMCTFTMGVLAVALISSSGSSEFAALADLVFILEYNWKKGYSGRLVQYGCYLFYPAHLLLLGLMFVAPRL